MEDIQRYLLSVIVAAIICSIATRFSGEKGMISSMIKLLAGLFMAITVIAPVIKLQITDFSDYLGDIKTDAEIYISDAESVVSNEKSEIISEQIESYILDKAASLDMAVNAEVSLSTIDNQTPSSVVLIGEVTPYKKQRLRQIIESELGIPEENQSWILE